MTTAVLRAMTIPAATFAVAIALGALFASPTARAGEYCSLDSDYTRDCGFSSIEQCEASRSGRGGDCMRDPFLKDNLTSNRDAYAYAPLSHHHARIGRTSAAVKTNK